MKGTLGYQIDEIAAASRMTSQGVLPHRHEFHLAVQEATPTKTTLENITLLLIRITSVSSINFYRNGELPSNQIGRGGAQGKKTERKIRRRAYMFSKKILEFGHFNLMFCTGRQRNVPKF